MKMTVDLPPDVVRAVKLRAVMEQRPVKQLVAETLRTGLGMSPASAPAPKTPGVEIRANGLPLVRCSPDAPARRMTVRELLALEQASQIEEDLQRAGRPV